ncbi:MAG: Hsp20/alpha crystallin family protein [Candidatus Omnitrophica bacterium]|nr:Hsp20/alpha crystallin family protein [Candidatus Omnitrophota bacterium]
MLNRKVNLASTLLMAGLMAGSAQAAATDDISALKDQVAQLQAKVMVLEEQLAQKPLGQPQVSHSIPVMNEDFMDPFEQMAAMDQQMQGMMSGVGLPMNTMKPHAAFFKPDYDIKATDKGYLISFDMPGMDKAKINVEVKNGALLVSGERSSEDKEEQKGKFYRQQRSFGYFSRAIPLPQDVKPETVTAKYENGVLNITVDKKDAAQQAPVKQKIEVK